MFIEKGIENTCRQRFKKEEHISLIAEPGGKYVAHLSSQNSKAETIADVLFLHINNNCSAVGCDGTVVNWKKS